MTNEMTVATPELCGFDAPALRDAVRFAVDRESLMDRDIARALDGGHFSEPMPDGEIIGPVFPRGDPSGMILRNGKVVAQWGPVDAPDMTFSVTKSYLAICAGLAWDDGLIDLDGPACETVRDLFDAPQNRGITWRHLLQQTSEYPRAMRPMLSSKTGRATTAIRSSSINPSSPGRTSTTD